MSSARDWVDLTKSDTDSGSDSDSDQVGQSVGGQSENINGEHLPPETVNAIAKLVPGNGPFVYFRDLLKLRRDSLKALVGSSSNLSKQALVDLVYGKRFSRGHTSSSSSAPSSTNSPREAQVLGDTNLMFEIRTTNHGFGIFSTRAIPYGTYVTSYAGPVITHSEAIEDRKHGLDSHHLSTTAMREVISGDRVPTTRHGAGSFTNHSTVSNLKKEVVGNCVYFRASTNIPPGRELLFNYGSGYWNQDQSFPITHTIYIARDRSGQVLCRDGTIAELHTPVNRYFKSGRDKLDQTVLSTGKAVRVVMITTDRVPEPPLTLQKLDWFKLG